MSKSSKLVFFGNERLATAATTLTPTLRALISAGYEIEAVVTSHIDAISRQKRDLEISPIAQAHNIPLILAENKASMIEKLKDHKTEAAILVAFGQIIPTEVINFFPKGIINIHPSLLPALRGPTPVETAILEGFNETGVSLMQIASRMDSGPVYAQEKVALKGSETKFDLAQKLNAIGAELLLKNLARILDGSLEPHEQDNAKASYTQLLKKEDGLIRWEKPAEQIEKEVRAYLGWPKSKSTIFGHEVVITKARIAKDKNDGGLVMECSPGWLEIEELIAPSGRKITGTEFLRGYAKS
jgi:methionyl-tRNA formyltransferase